MIRTLTPQKIKRMVERHGKKAVGEDIVLMARQELEYESDIFWWEPDMELCYHYKTRVLTPQKVQHLINQFGEQQTGEILVLFALGEAETESEDGPPHEAIYKPPQNLTADVGYTPDEVEELINRNGEQFTGRLLLEIALKHGTIYGWTKEDVGSLTNKHGEDSVAGMLLTICRSVEGRTQMAKDWKEAQDAQSERATNLNQVSPIRPTIWEADLETNGYYIQVDEKRYRNIDEYNAEQAERRNNRWSVRNIVRGMVVLGLSVWAGTKLSERLQDE